jgi:hypothetical protein
MQPEQNIIEAEERFGTRRKRARAKSKPAVLETHIPEFEQLKRELAEIKQEKQLLEARERSLRDQIVEHYLDIKDANIAKGRRINRVNHVSEADGPCTIEIQDKNQFRQVKIEDYEPLPPLIGHVLYEAFIEELWLAEPCDEFDPGKLEEAVIMGLFALLQKYDLDPNVADTVAEYTWNVLQNWFTFDTRLKVKNQDFSHRFELLRHQVTDEQLQNWMEFERYCRYKPAVKVHL